jgi:hypothetical protein
MTYGRQIRHDPARPGHRHQRDVESDDPVEPGHDESFARVSRFGGWYTSVEIIRTVAPAGQNLIPLVSIGGSSSHQGVSNRHLPRSTFKDVAGMPRVALSRHRAWL